MDGSRIGVQYAADETLVEVLADMRSRGFDGDFSVDDDGALSCRTCGLSRPPDQALVSGLRRIEGASDPGDMAAVVAATCPACGQRGTAVLRFGPEVADGELAFLAALPCRPGVHVPPAEIPARGRVSKATPATG